MTTKNGGELVVEALEKRGVEMVFGLSGGHIFPIEDSLERTRIRYITTRHEQAAVFMAEAYGRIRRTPGVALVTAGPGFTNALTAIQNAFVANVPLLLIAGAVGLGAREKIDLQDVLQLPVIKPMVKKAYICHKTERIPEFVDLAWRAAGSGRCGPVYLELPVDVLGAETEEREVRKPETRCQSKAADKQGAAQLVNMLIESRKPMIVAGSGAYYSGAGEEIIAMAEKAGVPVFTATQGRGTVSDSNPLCFGSPLFVYPGAAPHAITETDLIIFLGNRVSLLHGFGDILNPDAKFVQVDIEPEEIGRNKSVDLGVLSDIKAFVKECIDRIDELEIGATLLSQFKPWVQTLSQAAKKQIAISEENWKGEEGLIHPWKLATEIDAFMNKEDDIVAADGGDMQIWMSLKRTCRLPGHYLETGLYGCLGVGLPYGNAAKLLNPDKRVLTVIGDGSFGFNFMEMETAIRYDIPLVVVIGNDLGWGMVRHAMQLKLGRVLNGSCEIGRINYHNLVKELGGVGMMVEKAGDIRPALQEAFASGKTACLNVMTDPKPISPGSLALAKIGGYKV